ncbi:MAG: RNA pseudouridine synthase [Fimbriimonadaceae bacterium]|nr:RNA pseudouridine synthase [Chitinophagales bacterium]
MAILYEDNHLIAINKKSGEISQGDKTGDSPLGDTVKHYLKEKYKKPGNVYLGVVHRLDRPVSGVILFAKTGKAATRMSNKLRDREIQKTYWAVVKNKPPEIEATITHYLIKNEKLNKSFAYKQEKQNTKIAKLHYKLIASINNYYLLEIKPETGRHHQIRVQIAAIGCPIKGDIKYGFDRTNTDGSIHLHARQIEFMHPVKNDPVSIFADPPNDIIWNAFAESMKVNMR